MNPQGVTFERIECLEGTWTPMMALGEDHFLGTVRHTVYTPGPFGTTTQTLKARHFAFPRAPYTHGPDEIVEISSDVTGAAESESALEPEPELDDAIEDPDYVPSEHSVSSMSEDDSDDSGFTLSPELPPSPEYHPGPMEDDPDYPAEVHADGVDPLAAIVEEDLEEDPEEDDSDEYFHIPDEDVVIIDSASDSEPEPNDSVVILSD